MRHSGRIVNRELINSNNEFSNNIKSIHSSKTMNIFKNQMWDSESKTGLYTKEFLMTMYYEKINSPAL